MKYRIKNKELEAIIWTGKNTRELLLFIGDSDKASITNAKNPQLVIITENNCYTIAEIGMMIFKSTTGLFQQCDPVFFNSVYSVKSSIVDKMLYDRRN